MLQRFKSVDFDATVKRRLFSPATLSMSLGVCGPYPSQAGPSGATAGFADAEPLSAAIPGADLVEYIGGSPYIDDITVGGLSLDGDGMIAIPDKPGLGITLDRDAVRELTRGSDRIFGA